MLESQPIRGRGRPSKLTSLSFLPKDPHLSDVSVLYDELGYAKSRHYRHAVFYKDLNTYLEDFKSHEGTCGTERIDLQNQRHRDMLIEMTNSFLERDGRGRKYWPGNTDEALRLGLQYSKHKSKIVEKVLHLFLILNWDLNKRISLFAIEASMADQGICREQLVPNSVQNTQRGSLMADSAQTDENPNFGKTQTRPNLISNPTSSTDRRTFRTHRFFQPSVEDAVDDHFACISRAGRDSSSGSGPANRPRNPTLSPDELAPTTPKKRRRSIQSEPQGATARKRWKGKQVIRPEQPDCAKEAGSYSDASRSEKRTAGKYQAGSFGSHAVPCKRSTVPHQPRNSQRRCSNNNMPPGEFAYFLHDKTRKIPVNGLNIPRERSLSIGEASSSRRNISGHRAERLVSTPPEPLNISRGRMIYSVFTRPRVNERWNPKDADLFSLGRLYKAVPIEVRYRGLEFVLRLPRTLLRQTILNHDEDAYQEMRSRFLEWMDHFNAEYELMDRYFMVELVIAPIYP